MQEHRSYSAPEEIRRLVLPGRSSVNSVRNRRPRRRPLLHPHALKGNDDTDRQVSAGADPHSAALPFQISEAARLMVSASTAVLKKNAVIACSVARRRKGLVKIDTSDVCDAAPNEVAK
jgi:hypothetical protein